MRDELSGTDPILPWKRVFPMFFSYWRKSLNCQIFGADLSSGPPQTWSEERLQPLPPPWAARRPEITQRYPARHQLIDEDSII